MSNIYIHENSTIAALDPNRAFFEVVERKFRGHPDSLADMVAQSFVQKYIRETWEKFPKLSNTYFPNFSADKITLCGASTKYHSNLCEVIKPIEALLIGKITQKIGDIDIDVDAIFKDAIETIFTKCLGHDDYKSHVARKNYSVSLAGSDHGKGFYKPNSEEELLSILKDETHANDTVYVVAYFPLSVTEKLSIHLDNFTASEIFKKKFPEIGSDIKAMIRRRSSIFEITICLPIFPEQVKNDIEYDTILKNATKYLYDEIIFFLKNFSADFKKPTVKLWTNTKDTKTKRYYAVWGTALSKGDIGAVGRGNRQQGFISGIRPSTNEAMSGKNPNHFAGIIYQLVAENISQLIFTGAGLKNAVYITTNNGDLLENPNSVDIILENGAINYNEETIKNIISSTLKSIPELRTRFIYSDPYERFMCSKVYLS